MSTTTRRILLIDDNRVAADTMAQVLRLDGHEVTTAYDGEDAMDLARSQPPDVVICDINMPGMSGLEVARGLRQELGLRSALLVALSGYDEEADRNRAREAGFDTHFTKPMSLNCLSALMASNGFLSRQLAPAEQDFGITPLNPFGVQMPPNL